MTTVGSSGQTFDPTGNRGPGKSATLVVGRTLGTVVLALHGEIEGPGPPYLGAVLHDLIDGQGNLALVVDLGGARRLDHSVVEVLRTAARSMNRRGGCLGLARPSQMVANALTAADLADLVIDAGGQRRRPALNAGSARMPHRPDERRDSIRTSEVTP